MIGVADETESSISYLCYHLMFLPGSNGLICRKDALLSPSPSKNITILISFNSDKYLMIKISSNLLKTSILDQHCLSFFQLISWLYFLPIRLSKYSSGYNNNPDNIIEQCLSFSSTATRNQRKASSDSTTSTKI